MLANRREISLERESIDGKMPLFAACYRCHLNVVKILILQGAAMEGVRFLRVLHRSSLHVCHKMSLNGVWKLRRWIMKLVDDEVVI